MILFKRTIFTQEKKLKFSKINANISTQKLILRGYYEK